MSGRTKIMNFTLEGKALRLTGLVRKGKTLYQIEMKDEETNNLLTYGQLCDLHRRLIEDICEWDGILADRFTGACGCDVVLDFEKTWKGRECHAEPTESTKCRPTAE